MFILNFLGFLTLIMLRYVILPFRGGESTPRIYKG